MVLGSTLLMCCKETYCTNTCSSAQGAHGLKLLCYVSNNRTRAHEYHHFVHCIVFPLQCESPTSVWVSDLCVPLPAAEPDTPSSTCISCCYSVFTCIFCCCMSRGSMSCGMHCIVSNFIQRGSGTHAEVNRNGSWKLFTAVFDSPSS